MLRIARGPRALETALLAALEPLLARDASALAEPVRIAVASQSLRLHLSRRLAERFGAVAGVQVQTLHRLAVEILERSGAAHPGDLLYPVLARRAARAEPLLRERLEPLVDGYGVVEAAVSDLLDAGFEPPLFEAVCDAVREAAEGELCERALAVVRVAAATAQELDRAGVGHRSRLYRAAREELERDPEQALPCRALFVHGFADATGVQGDLIEALVRRRHAVVWLDDPPDPAEPGRVDSGVAFGERLRLRLAAAADESAKPADPPQIAVLHAPGDHAEVRGVAWRVRELLDAGAAPEAIGVVARHLPPYAVPIRLHFRRLGIPFSGVGAAGPPGPTGRRLAALGRLLRRREDTALEHWLDAVEHLPGGEGALRAGDRADLLLGLHTLGAARLEDAAELSAPDGDLPLPVRLGLAAPDAPERRPPRRRLAHGLLDTAIRAARALAVRLRTWPQRAGVASHAERLRDLAADDLGWSADADALRALDSALFDEAGAVPALDLDADDFWLLALRALARGADEPLGGRGAGVQVLDVMEARGRSFEHLFVVGLSRDAFPRSVHEDPLLPDALRRRLRRDVLDALPVKSDGHDEERYLFASLLASAPEVTLSAPVADEDGKARPVSPLLERLGFAPHVPEPQRLPSLYAAPSAPTGPRPAHEHALLAGLHGRRDRFERALARAYAERDRERGGEASDPAELAAARRRVLAELDPGRADAGRLGPYFGFVGPVVEASDPRRKEVYVTAVEGVARCAWQTFLTRLLRVEPVPDPHGELPSASPAEAALWIGSLVHRVLERIADAALDDDGADLGALAARTPRPVAWPDAATLERLLAACADELVREEGIGLPGYGTLLALHARAPLEMARLLDWPGPGAAFGALGAEVEGRVPLDGGRELFFKADRVDGDGRTLRLVDYKTGKPFSDQKKPSTRRAKFLERVSRGDLLQAVAYARAGLSCGAPAAEGRYVYLRDREGDDFPERVFPAPADDVELGAAFDGAVGAALDAWERGSFAPRLLEPGKDDEHHACERCSVKEACLRGDSGARRRLARWVADGAVARSPAEDALLAVWRLHEKSP